MPAIKQALLGVALGAGLYFVSDRLLIPSVDALPYYSIKPHSLVCHF